MTDPVDTDALRTWAAARADAKLLPMIRAAADEVDRLREELDAWEPLWRRMRDERDNARAAGELLMQQRDGERELGAAAEQERGHLRATIEDAPHMDSCRVSYLSTYPNARCTCWKAEVR